MAARAALRWTWTVTGGPCDELFASQDKPTSCTVSGNDGPALTLRATQAGDYAVHVVIESAAGAADCKFVVHIAGTGLGVELCWSTSGIDDLDLHVHRPHATTDWFDANNDCYYFNCSVPVPHVHWGYSATARTTCFESESGSPGPVLAVVVDSALARGALGLPCTPTTFAPARDPPQGELWFDDAS